MSWFGSSHRRDISHTAPPGRRRGGSRLAGLLVAALLVASCGGGGGDASTETEVDRTATEPGTSSGGLITPSDVATLAAQGVTVIDVRTPEEYAEGHLEGSTLIDFYEADFADRIADLDRDGEYLLYCRSGNRSGQAASLMQELGFETVFDLDGGILAYDAEGLPLER